MTEPTQQPEPPGPTDTAASGNGAASDDALLRLESVNTYYGPIHILQGLSIEVRAGELVCLLGGNASGKSTTLKTVLGIVKPKSGAVRFEGEDVTTKSTSYRIGKGIAIVPENRRLFAPMSVLENLEMGAYRRAARPHWARNLERIFALFPVLAERRDQLAGTLSGGEQQMLAIGRGLAAEPRLLMLDEPSMGLAPAIADLIFERIGALHREDGLTILLVEQRVAEAVQSCDMGYVLETGRVVLAGGSEVLLNDDRIRTVYLGM